MRSLTNTKNVPWSVAVIEKLSGPHIFDFSAVVLASVVVTLARFTAYSQSPSKELAYFIGALIVSQLFAAGFLLVISSLLVKIPRTRDRADLVIAASLFSNVIWWIAMDTVLAQWQVTQVEYTQWQILSGLIFSSFTVIGFSLGINLFYENIELEKNANEIVSKLQIKMIKTRQDIKDTRAFLSRELSLEVQATSESLETMRDALTLNDTVVSKVAELSEALNAVTVFNRNMVKRYPAGSKSPESFPKIIYNARYIIASGTQRNKLLPIALGIVSIFGLSGWFKYSFESVGVFARVALLTSLGFVLFWVYERLFMPVLINFASWFRLFTFELTVIFYLLFWILIIGYISGDQQVGYNLAFASAVIPFTLLNVAAFGSGLIASSQRYRAALAELAETLTQELTKLEVVKNIESETFRSIFGGDLERSPTSASLILREAASNSDYQLQMIAIEKATEVWELTSSPLVALAPSAGMRSS